MKHLAAAIVLFSLGMPAATTRAVPIINGGFETGDLTGWKVSIPVDESEFSPSFPAPEPPWLMPAGTVRLESSDVRDYRELPPSPEGNYFLAVGTGDVWFINGATHNITASQSLKLDKGDILSGWSSFYNGDFERQDSAWVRVFDRSGMEMDTLWYEASGYPPFASVDYTGTTPWTRWQWTAPLADKYMLTLGVTTFGDNAFASYGLYDAIEVVAHVPEQEDKKNKKEKVKSIDALPENKDKPYSVPDAGSTTALLGVSVALIALARRKIAKSGVIV